MFVKQLVNHRQPGSPCWTRRGTRGQNPSCESRGPGTTSQREPHFEWSLGSILCPLPSVTSELGGLCDSLAQGQGRCWLSPIECQGEDGPTLNTFSTEWYWWSFWSQGQKKLKVPAGKKESHSTWKKKKSLQRWTRGKICSWKFPWISKYLFKPFLITNLPNWSMIHLLIIFFPWSYTDDNVETVKFFINCLFCVLLSPRSQEIKIK